MSASVHRDKTFALAAVFQAARLVNDLARRGRCDEAVEQALVNTSWVLDTDDINVIYGSNPATTLKLGLETLEASLSDQGPASESAAHWVRLVMSVLQAEKHFRQQPSAQQSLRTRLERLVATPPETASACTDALAQAYVESLGTLRFRIQIHGDARHLQSPRTPERIRALLLAGVRAAWLWQRLGGRRWHLVLTRGQILQEIRSIAKSV